MPAARRPPKSAPRHAPLTGRFALETPLGALLSDSRIRLLEAIDRVGSLNRAAREVPLSYKAAWDALDTLNRHAPEPLVHRATGGAGGGGTRLTDYARQLIALYRAMESSQQAILDRLDEVPPQADAPTVRALVRRLAIKTSARNQFAAMVTGLADRGGLVDVTLTLGHADAPPATGAVDTLQAEVTPEAVAEMGLQLGSEVYALLKAPAVDVRASAPRRRAGVNTLAGRLTALRPGETRCGVTLQLPGGHVLRAAVPPDDAQTLAVDAPAWAVFGADQVVLLTFA